MFRNGQYLEVIEASKDCLATVIVTVQEKIVSIKNKKITTNKWLQIEDWAELYKILKRAILRNDQRTDGSSCKNRGYQWKKSTRQLEITYTFEPPENIEDKVSLPTIKVHVSPAKRKPRKQETNYKSKEKKYELEDNVSGSTKDKNSFNRLIDTKNNRLKKISEKLRQNSCKKLETPHASERMCLSTKQNELKANRNRKYTLSDDLQNIPLEEYVPDVPKTKRPCTNFKYVPSNKSKLQNMEITINEYTPTLSNSEHILGNVSYVPNPIDKLKTSYETYEPSATTLISHDVLKEYIPNSKGIKPSIEEYEPDFKSPCKRMKFDDTYVPSSVQSIDSNSSLEKPKNSKKDLKHVRKVQ